METGIFSSGADSSTDSGLKQKIALTNQKHFTIYHAGDLNNWRWNGEPLAWNNNMSTNYQRELEKIKAAGFHPDVAMVPLDGRQENLFYLGLDDFMRTVGADMVLPMHFWEDFSVIDRLKGMECSADYRDRIVNLSKEGESFWYPETPSHDETGVLS